MLKTSSLIKKPAVAEKADHTVLCGIASHSPSWPRLFQTQKIWRWGVCDLRIGLKVVNRVPRRHFLFACSDTCCRNAQHQTDGRTGRQHYHANNRCACSTIG